MTRGFSVSADFEKDVEETRAASFISNSIGSIDASPPGAAAGQVLGPSQQSAVRWHSDEWARQSCVMAADRSFRPEGGAVGACLEWSRMTSHPAPESWA